jgi:hypothetical protein
MRKDLERSFRGQDEINSLALDSRDWEEHRKISVRIAGTYRTHSELRSRVLHTPLLNAISFVEVSRVVLRNICSMHGEDETGIEVAVERIDRKGVL